MASTVYSTLFLAANTGSGLLNYIVPDGFVAVLRDVDVYNNSVVLAELFLEDNETGQTIWRVDNSAVIPTLSIGSVQWKGRQVFNGGGGFVFTATAGVWDVRASGYLLTA